MRTNAIVRNTRFVTDADTFENVDVVIINGCLVEIIENAPHIEGIEEIDGTDYIVTPSLVDLHVHFREPGQEYKETIATGAMAAYKSGYSHVCTMPNLNPAPDSMEHLAKQLVPITKLDIPINVLPYASITIGQKGEGELVDFESLAPYVCGFSDDGRGVQSRELMLQAMEHAAENFRPIVAHCEVNELLKGGYIHDGKYAKEHNHRGICSESEYAQIARDIELVRETGCQYHVCHISTKESVELIRKAKAEGLPVTCETAPHYLLLTEDDLQEDGRFKMNPPLRSKEDRDALIKGIQDGTIDCIATDHAPHSAEEKSRGLEKSAFGITGIEIAFPLMYTYLVERGIISLERLVALMATNPRRIIHLDIAQMYHEAEFAIFDIKTAKKIDPQHFISMGKATPFEGWEAKGFCVRNLMS